MSELSNELYGRPCFEKPAVTDEKKNSDDTGIGPDAGDSSRSSPSPSKEEKKTDEITFPPYPKHGVIGDSDPDWMDIFHSAKNLEIQPRKDFRKHRFDFYEMYEKRLDNQNKVVYEATPIPGLYNLWREFNKGKKTSDVYEVDPNLPLRFKEPDLLQGYGCERNDTQQHPLFQTTSSSYGHFPPTVHDVPHEYHGLKNTFTKHLASTGMPKNRSLNIK